MQSTESDIVLDSNNFVISKCFVNIIRYYYNSEDTLTKKCIKFADNTEHTVNFEKAENDSQIVKFVAGGKTITSHSKTDNLGRKVFDELQLSTGFVSRQFSYHVGEATDNHIENNMLKSSPTTQLVSQIVLSNGRTLSYEYDAEEHITKVIDSVDGITEYTYDALGQLITEAHKDINGQNAEIVNEMVYDSYGNILQKNGIQYVYDEVWKDKLIRYNNKEITYDEQGNPTEYLGHNLTWEKGRQLKSFDNISYTYNANGIRTSKTIDGIRHDFVLDGAKILRETWDDDILETLYDNEDSVCGIIYNGEPYYFHKNLQGDVIAIVDDTGRVVAWYTYDAWGKCEISSASTNATIANINPYRYRGYYYDKEIEFYYLQSRYYDASIGRFVNGDDTEMVSLEFDVKFTTKNLFAYCYNDSINNTDETGYAGFRDLWNAIKSSFLFIKSIADQAYYACKGATPIKQIKKLSKQTGKSQRQIMRELKKLAADSERCFKRFKIAGNVISVLSVVIFAVSYLQNGKSLFSDIYALIIDLFIEAANWLICKIANLLCKAIPACGLIIGFGVSWVIGMLISSFFTASRKKKMTKKYTAIMKKSTRWYDWFINLFYSVPAAF